MAEQDGYVQVAVDGVGKKIDNAELTRAPETPGATGDVVYRQRVVIASDENPQIQAEVAGESGRGELHVRSHDTDAIIEKLDEIVGILRMLLG